MTDSATEEPRHTDATHDHGWLTESSHQTSEGRVVYVRCALCGVRRVDLQRHPLLPPRALSREHGEPAIKTRAPSQAEHPWSTSEP